MDNLKIAVVLFANSAEYEARNKPFQASKEIFESLNHHTLELVKKTGIPYFIITEHEQIGDSFGVRFTNAMQAVYNLGYESLIIIGNDTPHLSVKLLKKAEERINKNETVIGKSKDGGFYLLAIKKEFFNRTLFLNLPWQKATLSTRIVGLSSIKSSTVFNLEKLSDIDCFNDIETIIHSYKKIYDFLFRLFLNIVSGSKKSFDVTLVIILYSITFNLYNKGSPVFN